MLAAIVVVAALWAGYWFVGASGLKHGLETWFEARRAEGWVADTSDLRVQGFPNRFDAGFTDLALADPDTGLAWEAPFFQILALSYQPNHVIAVWPDRQRIATPLDKFDVASDDMRASIVLEPGTALEMRRMTLTADTLSVDPIGRDDGMSMAALMLAADHVPVAEDPVYRLGLRADGFAPALAWKAAIDPKGSLPDTFAALSADLTVRFDKPWDRRAIEDARPQPQAITLRLAEARWGQLELAAAGDVTVDSAGLPTGRITIKARNWRDILGLARAAGAIPEALSATIENGLSLMSQMAGNPETLDIALDFRNGRTLIGPIPLGPAPVLRLR